MKEKGIRWLAPAGVVASMVLMFLVSGCCIENGEGCTADDHCCSGCCSIDDPPFTTNLCYECDEEEASAGEAQRDRRLCLGTVFRSR